MKGERACEDLCVSGVINIPDRTEETAARPRRSISSLNHRSAVTPPHWRDFRGVKSMRLEQATSYRGDQPCSVPELCCVSQSEPRTNRDSSEADQEAC
ncbi:unnamed protein product [Merluccius merluccius]